MGCSSYFWKISESVAVEEEFLQTPGIPYNVFWDRVQGAVSFVDILNLPVAPLEDGDALEHGCKMPLFSHCTIAGHFTLLLYNFLDGLGQVYS